MGATLADGGLNPVTGERVVAPTSATTRSPSWHRRLYETSGDWLWEIGLPGKSGIGGGIVTVSPARAASGPSPRGWTRPATASAASSPRSSSRAGSASTSWSPARATPPVNDSLTRPLERRPGLSLGSRSMRMGRVILALALAGALPAAAEIPAPTDATLVVAALEPMPRPGRAGPGSALHRRRRPLHPALQLRPRRLRRHRGGGAEERPRPELLRPADLEGEPVRRRRGQPGRGTGDRPVHARHRRAPRPRRPVQPRRRAGRVGRLPRRPQPRATATSASPRWPTTAARREPTVSSPAPPACPTRPAPTSRRSPASVAPRPGATRRRRPSTWRWPATAASRPPASPGPRTVRSASSAPRRCCGPGG